MEYSFRQDLDIKVFNLIKAINNLMVMAMAIMVVLVPYIMENQGIMSASKAKEIIAKVGIAMVVGIEDIEVIRVIRDIEVVVRGIRDIEDIEDIIELVQVEFHLDKQQGQNWG